MTRSRRLTLAVAVAGATMLLLAPSGPAGPFARTCDCQKVRGVATAFSTVQNPGQPVSVALTIKATLTCLVGGGATCTGSLVAQQPLKTPPPTATDAQIVTPTNGVIRCTGRCAQATKHSVRLEFRSAQDLKFSERKNETWIFKLKSFCQHGKLRVAGSTVRISVVFGSSGEFDQSRSDLNANGIPDGQE